MGERGLELGVERVSDLSGWGVRIFLIEIPIRRNLACLGYGKKTILS